MRPILPAILLCACASTDSSTDDGTINWSGYVLLDPYAAGDTQTLTDGSVEFTDLAGESLAFAEQPYEDTPGWWEVDVLPSLDVAIRIASPAQLSTVWRGQSPSDRSNWLTGALFSRSAATLGPYLDAIEPLLDAPAADLEDGERVHLWCEPLDGAAWTGATITLTDGDGQPGTWLALAVAEDGTLVEAGDGPIALLLGVDLAPGDITLAVDSPSRGMASTTWPTQGGDLIAAHYFALPE